MELKKEKKTVDINGEKYVTISQYAAMSGVSRASVYYWIETNKVEMIDIAGKKLIKLD